MYYLPTPLKNTLAFHVVRNNSMEKIDKEVILH